MAGQFLSLLMVVAALLVPVNIFNAIVPHLHDYGEMRMLHLISASVFAVALGLLLSNCPITKGRCVPPVKFLAITYALFLLIMVVVNVNIARTGMGVDYGWLDHYLLAFGSIIIVWQARNRQLKRL